MDSNSDSNQEIADDHWVKGSQYLRNNRLNQAEICFEKALSISPKHAYALNNLGVVKEKRGLRREAVALYRLALQKLPGNAVITWNLASILTTSHIRKREEAERHLEAAVRAVSSGGAHRGTQMVINPGQVFYVNLTYGVPTSCGGLLACQAIDPIDVYTKLGEDFLKDDQLLLAEENFMKALRIWPAYLEPLRGMVETKKRRGLIEEAIEYMMKIMKRIHGLSTHHIELALLYSKLWKTDRVVRNCQEAMRLMLEDRGAIVDGETQPLTNPQVLKFQAASSIGPFSHGARLTAVCELLLYLQKVAYWAENRDFTDAVASLSEKFLDVGYLRDAALDLASIHSLYDCVRKEMAVLCATKAERDASLLKNTTYQFPQPNGQNRRLKIGFLLGHRDYDGDYDNLALMDAVIGNLDRSKVEVFVYAAGSQKANFEDGRPPKIENRVEHFVNLLKLKKDEKVADRIHANGINILIGMTNVRNVIFAMRPAPVQVAWLGNMGSSDANFIDYFVTDRVATPMEHARHFTEKLAYMPNSCYVGNHTETPSDATKELETPKAEEQPEPEPQPQRSLFQRLLSWFDLTSQPDVEEIMPRDSRTKEIGTRKRYGLPETAVVYGNFSGFYKYDETTAEIWATILKRVPDSVLWLLRDPAAGERNVRKFFGGHGIAMRRILFCDVTTDTEELMRRGRLVDVYLDTSMCSTGAVGLDILWLGVPMVTFPRESFISRVSASQLSALGCPELVAGSRLEYARIASELGKNPDKLREVRTRISVARSESKLFDLEQYCRDFEELLFKMWRRYKNNTKPDHIVE